jgi:GTP-binding protein HflX
VQRKKKNDETHLHELKNLAETAGYIVTGILIQIRRQDPSYQIGRGKVEELKNLVKKHDCQRIIFYNNLKPIQSYNLVKATGVEAIDRFQLILEIFAKRASNKEAKLQIKLANLRYQLPRAREKVRLSRMGEQPGFLGMGRYEVDVYYEAIRRQIAYIQKNLKKIRKKRSLHRERRFELGYTVVALAGYTNAGKSSLFNSLVKESMPVDSGLFTTLSTTTRAMDIKGKRGLLTDTVGFIERLPLALIESFHSTLEETIFSDIILLVVDLSEPLSKINSKLNYCLETIQEIGAINIPVVTALNKIDLLTEEGLNHKLNRLMNKAPNPVPISAIKRTNLEILKEKLSKQINDYSEAIFILPINNHTISFVSELKNRVNQFEVKYCEKMKVKFTALSWYINKIRDKIDMMGGKLIEVKNT